MATLITNIRGPAGERGETGATGAPGNPGAAGPRGATIWSGTTNPTPTVPAGQAQGDFYLNTATSTLFGPRTATAWPAGVSLVGSAGAPGQQGPPGAPGAPGPAPVFSPTPPASPVVGQLWVDTS